MGQRDHPGDLTEAWQMSEGEVDGPVSLGATRGGAGDLKGRLVLRGIETRNHHALGELVDHARGPFRGGKRKGWRR